MDANRKHIELIMNRIPILGILCFISLFIWSSMLYSGGSQANLNSEGFDWMNNYWCNLMGKKGMNGKFNPARPYAITAMIILCMSLMLFFIQFAKVYSENRFWKRVLNLGGILSMLSACFIFTDYHDLMTIISSFFGVFLVIGIIKEVYQSELLNYKIGGGICLFLLLLNNCIYYSLQFIEWLPFIQKVTFLAVLIWIIGLNYELRKTIKAR
ncbi:MAG: hypothetical protein GY810_05515 [Aureispira sp.]|nr:hypothetical protein [Aureispira sp.]